MTILLRCPECETSLRLAAAPTAGQRVKCPKCGTAFLPAAGGGNEPPPPAPAPRSLPNEDEDPAPARRSVTKTRRDEGDEDDRPAAQKRRSADDDEDRPRKSRKKTSDANDEDEDDRPRKSRKIKSEANDDDEDDQPRKSQNKKREANDEDEDDRPRKSRKKKSEQGNVGLLIGLLLGGVFVALLIVGGLVWALAGKKADPDGATATSTESRSDAASNTNPQTNPTPNPGAPPPSKELLEKTKRATALIRVDAGTKGATGSGFLVRANADAAYVVTNFHVIDLRDDEPPPAVGPAPAGPGRPPRRPPGIPGRPPGFPGRPPGFPGRPPGFGPPAFGPAGPKQPESKPRVKTKVFVVLNSGTPEEQSYPAEVVGIDPEADLATLRISGARNVPEPLDVTQDAPVRETMPVFIFGFPGGNKTITVGEGKITQLRRDDSDVLNDVQLAGEIAPGNSGGPVVDAQGRLIGIAVATVRGKNIGFAVPAAQLDHMLKGSVLGGIVCRVRQQGTRLDATGELWFLDRKYKVRARDIFQGQIGESATPVAIPQNEFLVLAALNDPMRKINTVQLHYAPATTTSAQTGATGWAPIANAQTVTLKVRDDEAIGTLKLPAGSVADDTYAFQFSYTNADGRTVFTQPHPLRLTFPKNPKSVTLLITAPADDPTRRYIEDTVVKTFAGSSVKTSRTPQGVTVEIDPVDDPKTVVEKIKFAEAVTVEGRTITVTVRSIALPAPTDQDLALALNDLNSGDGNRRKAGAERLAKVYAIVEERREEVAKALEAAALDKDIFLRLGALRALSMWSGPENVPGLIRGLDIQEGQTRVAICGILAKYKDPAAAPALAKLLPAGFERGAASAALKAIGPAAEKAVIPYLTHKDSWTSREACYILKEIGTEASLAPLQEVLKGKPDFMVGPAAAESLKAIQARQKKAGPK